MRLENKTEKKVIGWRKKEVTVVTEPLTQEEARKMYSYRPISKYAESRFGGNNPTDDVALLLSEDAIRCKMCQAATLSKYLINEICPDCDGRSEYNGNNPRTLIKR